MANTNKKFKFGYGNEERIQAAVDAGKFDGGDLILTKNTHRFAFIDTTTNELFFTKAQIETFDSMENAIAYTATEQAYNGEIIPIKIDDKYRTYRLQPTSNGYELESLEQVQKAYVQIIDEFPTENQEAGVIYIVGSTGKIWNGSEYLTVFEDLQPIRDELNKKAPIDSPEFTGKVTIEGVEVSTVESVDSKLRLSEPYITGRELVANGYGLIIDALDDNTNRATYYTSGQKKYIDFPSGYSVVGGAVDNNVFSSSIVMNSGNVNIIQGGSDGDGAVSEADIVVNGGTVKSIVGGGYPNLEYSGKANHTGCVRITVNNIEGTPSIFGGGYSYASVGNVVINIKGGNYDYVTAAGSNGSVGYGRVNVDGGIINVLQGTNHGYIGFANLYVNDGIVKSLYAGMEPGDDNIGSFGRVHIGINNGTVEHVYKGQNNDTSDYSNNYLSGYYYDGLVPDDEATILGLDKKEQTTATVEDVAGSKQEAVTESKNYVDSVLTIKEF